MVAGPAVTAALVRPRPAGRGAFAVWGVWWASVWLAESSDEAGEETGKGLALLIRPADHGTGELAAAVLVHPLKVGAPACGELEQRAAAVVLVGHAAQQAGGDSLPGQLAGTGLVKAEVAAEAGHGGLLAAVIVGLDDVKDLRHRSADGQAVFVFGAAGQRPAVLPAADGDHRLLDHGLRLLSHVAPHAEMIHNH